MKAAVSKELKDTIELQRLKGQIHSKYKNTLNIECNGKLVSVLLTDRRYPGSICLEESPFWWNEMHLCDTISVDRSGIWLNGKLLDDFAEISYFESEVVCIGKEFLMDDLWSVLLQLETFLQERTTGMGVEGLLQILSHGRQSWNDNNPYVEFLKPRLTFLLKRLHKEDWNQADAAIPAFMGCGIGLTPSSDDFLCGFLLITGMYDRSIRDGSWIRHVKDIVDSKAVFRTTAVSAKYLQESAAGMATDVMQQLLYGIASGQKNLESLFKLQSQVGSTSGTDTLTGLCFGMDYIMEERGM